MIKCYNYPQTYVANVVCQKYEDDGVVCPLGLGKNVFTTSAAVANIDHNPSSTTSRDSFNGTAISLTFNHISDSCPGVECNAVHRAKLLQTFLQVT